MLGLKGWRKNLTIALCSGLCLFAAARVYYNVTDDIRLGNMKHDMAYRQEWEIPPLSSDQQKELDLIFGQNFHYLGKGAQSYAFVSDDGEYVLKFFKFKHLRTSPFEVLIPPVYPFKEYKEKQALRKLKKLESVFEGYRLAYLVHKDQSGLLYIHLNQTKDLNKTVTLKDKIGLSHLVDLDQYVFVVQKKVTMTRNELRSLLKKGDIGQAKKQIGRLLDLYASEYQKGVYDRDHGILHNTGFIGETPIHLDVGKFSMEENMKDPKIAKADMEKVEEKFHLWIQANFPQYSKEIDEEMNRRIAELFPSESL